MPMFRHLKCLRALVGDCGALRGKQSCHFQAQKSLFSTHSEDAGTSIQDIGLTEDQISYRDVASKFAAEKFAPFSAMWDEKKIFDLEALREAAQLGFGGVYVRDDVGGTGLGRADAAVIFEALAYGDVSHTAYLTIHNMASWPSTTAQTPHTAHMLHAIVHSCCLLHSTYVSCHCVQLLHREPYIWL